MFKTFRYQYLFRVAKITRSKFIWKLFLQRTTEIIRNFLHKVICLSRWNQHVWRDFGLINIGLQINPEKTICVRRYETNVESLLFMTKIQNMNNVYFANMLLCIVVPYYRCMLLNSCCWNQELYLFHLQQQSSCAIYVKHHAFTKLT